MLSPNPAHQNRAINATINQDFDACESLFLKPTGW
jgi:hypothetical protein